MLAIVYLFISIVVGDLICRRFFTSASLLHRLAAAVLVGLVVCSWASYLIALSFYRTQNPMLYSSIVFFLAAAALLVIIIRKHRSPTSLISIGNDNRSDWIFAGVLFLFSCWLMFGTFGITNDNLRIAAFLTNDFGPNLALVQSFAVGRNFPAEYPHFIGEPIRYHFLFWFQAGNLEYLGLSIASGLNLLSSLTLTAMLLMIDAFARSVFSSRAAGRIAAALFFFHGSLSYIPFLLAKGSVSAMFWAAYGVTEWIPSIYNYTGEQWGVWSIGTFLAQRHLPGAIGFLLVVFLSVIEQVSDPSRPHAASGVGPYILAGLLLGLLPMWNGAVFVAGFALIGSTILFFRNRPHVFLLLMTAGIIAIPQVLYLRSGGSRGLLGLFHWGYVVAPPTVFNVAEYFSFTFGVKFLLAAIAAVLLSAFHRKLFLAAFSLVVLAFSTQLSTDVMNNHKFLNLWLVIINGYAAYTLITIAKLRYAGKALAALLFMFIAVGGLIELFRVRNINMVEVPYGSGPLYEWLNNSTEPRDIFLTNNHVTHPILLAGRRIFYGWGYFGWSMGYDTGKRDEELKRMYTEQHVDELLPMLKSKNIRFVAFDEGVRSGPLAPGLNERVFEAEFEKVFVDHERKYGSLVIYRVPWSTDRSP